MDRFGLSDIQSRAIIDMRLRSLTGLERDKVKEEYNDLLKQIEHFKNILSDITLQMKIIRDEMLAIKEKYGDERRTEIIPNAEEFNPEDFYADEEVVITISRLGYIKEQLYQSIELRLGEALEQKVVILEMKILLNIFILQVCTIPCFSLLKKASVSG